MILKKIEIKSFGKFADYKIDFREGMNFIYGNNEDGKSTIMSFIKALFYSNLGTGKTTANLRTKYKPWNGMAMSGAIEFENDGTSYRLQKEIGTTAGKDVLEIFNLSTGEKVQLARDEEAGRHFFGLDIDGFERSVFIGQSGTIALSGKMNNKTDDIAEKLSNLAAAGNENISIPVVLKRLEDARDNMQSKRGDKGTLVDSRNKLDDLREQYRRAKDYEATQKDLNAEIETLTVRKKEISEKLGLIQKKIEYRELSGQITKWSNICAEIDKYNEARTEIERGRYTCEVISQMLSECTALTGEIDIIKQNIEGQEEKFARDAGEEVSDEELSAISRLSQRTAEAARLISLPSNASERVSQDYIDASSAATECANELKNTEQQIQTCNDKIQHSHEMAELRINPEQDKINTYKEGMASLKTKSGQAYTVSAAVSAAVAVVTGILALSGQLPSLSTLLIIVMLAGILCAAVTAVMRLRVNTYNKDVIAKRNEHSRKCDEISVKIDDIKKEDRNTCNELGTVMAGLLSHIDELKSKIVDYDAKKREIQESRSEELKSEYDKNKTELEAELKRKGCETVDEYRNLAIKRIAREREKNEILELNTQLTEKRNLLNSKLLDYVGADGTHYFDTEKLDTGVIIDGLNGKLAIIRDAAQRAENYAKIMGIKNESDVIGNCDMIYAKKSELESKARELAEEINDEETDTDSSLAQTKHELEEEAALVIEELEKQKAYSKPLDKSVNQLAAEIKDQEARVKEKEMRYNALDTACKIMNESADEIRTSFGPELNKRTADIFNMLTCGRYKSVLVNKDYGILAQPDGDTHFREYSYLSGGTADQVYLALRLAITELLSEQENRLLPLMLDDIFQQYDEARMSEGLKFFELYCTDKKRQIIFFTCHGDVIKAAEESGSPNIMKLAVL